MGRKSNYSEAYKREVVAKAEASGIQWETGLGSAFGNRISV